MSTPLWPTTIPTPEQDGYRIRRGNDVVTTRLPGGPARKRRDSLGSPHEVSCTFMVDRTEYTCLEGFFRERTQSRTKAFRIPLLIDAPVAVNHVARVLDEPEELGRTAGNLYVVQVLLEVIPNPIKSFSILLQSISDERVVDGGTADYSPEMSEFPVGRQVLLTGCAGLSNGTAVDLDGTYTIGSKPNAFTIVLTNAAVINADWTVLNGTASQALFPTNQQGACILLPE